MIPKFKAWLKNEKKMYGVHELSFYHGNIISVTLCDLKTFERPYLYFDFEDVELLPYIGREDNNGIEIYEGDIVKCYNKIAVVKYGHRNCGCCHDVYGFTFVDNNGVTDTPSFGDCEVIGNIYENSELLGGK